MPDAAHSAQSSSPPSALAAGEVTVLVTDGIATVSFHHPKGNSLPAPLLRELAAEIARVGTMSEAHVVVLRSGGEGPFCAGASFDELKAIADERAGQDFFMGFARVILAMTRCPKPIVTRVHGKVAGGGVGLVAASDYVLATETASLRLSELAVGIGPFVVGPAIQRRIGPAAFAAMALDAEWRDPRWAERHGLYAQIFDSTHAMDSGLEVFIHRLARANPAALAQLKQIFWEDVGHWETLLAERAAMSGRLVLSDFTRDAIAAFEKR